MSDEEANGQQDSAQQDEKPKPPKNIQFREGQIIKKKRKKGESQTEEGNDSSEKEAAED